MMVKKEKQKKSTKKARLAKDIHIWSINPATQGDETMDTLQDYVEKMGLNVAEKIKGVKLNKDSLKYSYALRRNEIMDNRRPVSELLERYPPLKKFGHVSALYTAT